MYSALFPVHKDIMTGAETPGSAKNGGGGEKNDQFARLLFVSMKNATNEEKTTAGTPGDAPLRTHEPRSLSSLAASLFGDIGEDACLFAGAPEETTEEDTQTDPGDVFAGLFASAFAAEGGAGARLYGGLAGLPQARRAFLLADRAAVLLGLWLALAPL